MSSQLAPTAPATGAAPQRLATGHLMPIPATLLRFVALSSCALFSAAAAWADCTSSLPATTPTNRFVVDSTDQGVVLDRKTGLSWKRCSVGMTYSAGKCTGTGSASPITYDGAQAAAVAAGGTWRVPNVKELSSIVERRCTHPAINTVVFPDGIPHRHWTSSPVVGSSYRAWYVDFRDGNVNFDDGGNYDYYGYVYYKVRLVRASQ